ncbi:kita-kyushu lung cancer antigen 1 [Saimiri boliviensis]|uniref:kita-kyushu lung cancer antigen 1 n=1 Tax=Saimiri boliviensis TaxID=27679 RepID=UPI00027F960B|nr:kita-kyushu lung cancer antigen 1 homolog [Saimiri boliviensis boliviensis]
MYILLLLASGILCALMFFFGKYRFQRNTDKIATAEMSTGEMSSNSTALAIVRPSSTRLINSNTVNHLSVNNFPRHILNTFPHSIAMQKRILVNLSMVEYKLAELEHILVSRGVRGASAHRKST